MLVLALDTTTRRGSCALARATATAVGIAADTDVVVLRTLAADDSQAPASRLPTDLMRLLEEAGTTLTEVDVFGVAIGPGSFTGLRVGIATMQGLAFAAGKPLIGISAMDALAVIAGSSGRVATWIDAWRGEVFASVYEAGVEIEPPAVVAPSAWLARLSDAPTLFIGDAAGTYADLITTTLPHATIAEPPAPLLAPVIAVLAARAAQRGLRPPPEAIRPLYVRRADPDRSSDAHPVG